MYLRSTHITRSHRVWHHKKFHFKSNNAITHTLRVCYVWWGWSGDSCASRRHDTTDRSYCKFQGGMNWHGYTRLEGDMCNLFCFSEINISFQKPKIECMNVECENKKVSSVWLDNSTRKNKFSPSDICVYIRICILPMGQKIFYNRMIVIQRLTSWGERRNLREITTVHILR